jgi:hypothetical protein
MKLFLSLISLAATCVLYATADTGAAGSAADDTLIAGEGDVCVGNRHSCSNDEPRVRCCMPYWCHGTKKVCFNPQHGPI